MMKRATANVRLCCYDDRESSSNVSAKSTSRNLSDNVRLLSGFDYIRWTPLAEKDQQKYQEEVFASNLHTKNPRSHFSSQNADISCHRRGKRSWGKSTGPFPSRPMLHADH